jgi:hypothetical protein
MHQRVELRFCMLQFEAAQMFVWPCGDAVHLAPKLTQSLASVIYSWLLTAFSVEREPIHRALLCRGHIALNGTNAVEVPQIHCVTG